MRDDCHAISSAIKESLERGIDCLIISGGLGPTPDDKTLEGVSLALDRKLELNGKALDMIRKSYERLSIDYHLNEFRQKMAMMPEDSVPIQNVVGIAPAVLIEVMSTKPTGIQIFCLPGIPAELKGIFSTGIITLLKRRISTKFYVIESTHEITGVGESMLSPFLLRIKNLDPLRTTIYVKTHPRGYTDDHKPRLQVQIVSKGKDRRDVQTKYREISRLLMDEIDKLNGKLMI